MYNSFENARSYVQGGLRPTVVTQGLNVAHTVTGLHLNEAYGSENDETINVGFAQLWSASSRYNKKPLIGMTEAKGKVKFINRAGFRWQLSGGNAQRARITNVRCTDPKPGQLLQPFEICVDKPWWNVSDIIQPETNKLRFRVEPMEGSSIKSYKQIGPNAFVYRIRIVSDDQRAFCPPAFIQLNKEWNKVSSAVATEDNIDGGGFQFYSVFESTGVTQQHSVKVSLTDKVARRCKQAIVDKNTPDAQDPTVTKWAQMVWFRGSDNKLDNAPQYRFIPLMDAEANEELYRNVENTLVFGKFSQSMVSPEGHQIFTASGLREQLESGHVYEHDGSMSLGELEEFFDNIMKDKVSEGQSKIVLGAGIKFRQMFDKMIKNESKSFVTMDTMFIRKGEDFRHLEFGSYYAHYQGFRVDISVMENPSYDNLELCPERHPVYPTYAIDSWRADILDFGQSNQMEAGVSDNICMVAETWTDYNIGINGKWRFDGASGLPITDGGVGMIGQVSGYAWQREKNAGLMIVDPTRCGTIYLSGQTY